MWMGLEGTAKGRRALGGLNIFSLYIVTTLQVYDMMQIKKNHPKLSLFNHLARKKILGHGSIIAYDCNGCTLFILDLSQLNLFVSKSLNYNHQ
jgi:hypothetical protein